LYVQSTETTVSEVYILQSERYIGSYARVILHISVDIRSAFPADIRSISTNIG